jgi:hypothetical protein
VRAIRIEQDLARYVREGSTQTGDHLTFYLEHCLRLNIKGD